MKTALNVDVTGQDSAYLAQFLLRFGYKVYDTHRPTITLNRRRLKHLDVWGIRNFILATVRSSPPTPCNPPLRTRDFKCVE
jgi:GDP-D-mannose dehydratase